MRDWSTWKTPEEKLARLGRPRVSRADRAAPSPCRVSRYDFTGIERGAVSRTNLRPSRPGTAAAARAPPPGTEIWTTPLTGRDEHGPAEHRARARPRGSPGAKEATLIVPP